MSGHDFCAFCGRPLVEVSPLTAGLGFVYRRCPKYPRNAWQRLLRREHESFWVAR
jgi:hypothetical protein